MKKSIKKQLIPEKKINPIKIHLRKKLDKNETILKNNSRFGGQRQLSGDVQREKGSGSRSVGAVVGSGVHASEVTDDGHDKGR